MTDATTLPAHAAGTLQLGGTRPIHRMGFGAMRITGEGVWGPPRDPEEAVALLRRTVELGVDLIDTADSYGPFVSEDLIRAALHTGGSDPQEAYDGVMIATKAGLVRTGPGEWHPLGRPEYLRFACEMSLRRLGVDAIELFQLHRLDPEVAAEDQLGELQALKDEGKIQHIGLSEVDLDQLTHARTLVEVVSVQNRYNLLDRGSDPVLDACEAAGIAFLPWFPVATGDLARPGGPLDEIAGEIGATPAQVALAWLLQRATVMVPIPGTSQQAHLEQNVGAAAVTLSAAHLATLDALV